MELFTERMLLKDVITALEKSKQKGIEKKCEDFKELSSAIAEEYDIKEDEIEFIRKNNPLDLKDIQIEDGERAAIRYINTADVDRDSEIVMPDGLQTRDFEKSKTVLYAHNYQGLPIGRDLWLKLIKGKGWLAKTLYASHLLANDVYNLVKDKFLNTSSIGFIPLESVKPDNKKWDKLKDKLISEWGIKGKLIDGVKRIYTKSLLLEHSDVPIPSNINALNIAVGKGLKIKSQELIDDLEIEIIDEEEKDSDDLNDKEKEVVLKPEETDDYIRIPVRDCKVTATITISADQGIKALYCGKIKKIRTYLFAKAKGWTMAKAKKWVADHGKEYDDIDIKDFEIEKEKSELVNDDTHKPDEKKEPDKGFNLDEIYEIVKKNKELIKALEEMTAELKAGAVLNRKNKTDLTNAQQLIQNVLDSAETAKPAEEGKEADGLEIEDDRELEIEEKEEQEQKDDTEEKEETFDIDKKELVKIIHSTLEEQLNKSAENISKNLKQDIDDSFKKLTGKVI